MRSYRPMAAQRASASGSTVWRLAFIGKSVRGRLSVSFQSAIGDPSILTKKRPAPRRGRRPAGEPWRWRSAPPAGAPDFHTELAGVVGVMVVVDPEEQLARPGHRNRGLIANRERTPVADAANQRPGEHVR